MGIKLKTTCRFVPVILRRRVVEAKSKHGGSAKETKVAVDPALPS